MSEKQRELRTGDIVRTPSGGIYGDKLAMVCGDKSGGIEVHTDRAILVYESDALIYAGKIELGKVFTDKKERGRVCWYVDTNDKRTHTCVRIRADDATEDDADETTRLYAFSILVADGTIV